MSMDTKPAVLSVGRLYCDLIFTDLPRFPSLGTEVFTDGFGTHAGGGAFITAAHLSALGHPSSLAAMLPSSPYSDLMRSELEASNVDLSLSASLPETAGPQITVAMSDGSDRAFLTRRAGPAIPPLSVNDIRRRNIKHLHVGELASLAAQPDVVDLAKSLGITLSVDCSWDDALDRAALEPLQGKVDLFLPNEVEWSRMQDLGMADGFATLTVIKRGAKGASALSPSGTVDVPTRPAEVLDSTGAGDAFNAGFLTRWLLGDDLTRCLNAGNARGALSLQRRGGFSAFAYDTSDVGVAGE